MKNKLTPKLGIVIPLLILMSLSVKAQIITGCVIYETNGAPRLSDGMYVSSTNSTTTCAGYRVRIYNTDEITAPLNTLCYTPVLPNTPGRKNCRIGQTGPCGYVREITIVDCLIDGYLGYLLFSSLVVGVYFIRKKS